MLRVQPDTAEDSILTSRALPSRKRMPHARPSLPGPSAIACMSMARPACRKLRQLLMPQASSNQITAWAAPITTSVGASSAFSDADRRESARPRGDPLDRGDGGRAAPVRAEPGGVPQPPRGPGGDCAAGARPSAVAAGAPPGGGDGGGADRAGDRLGDARWVGARLPIDIYVLFKVYVARDGLTGEQIITAAIEQLVWDARS
jgi:hypothetical protein